MIISIDKSDTDTVELFADEFQWPFGKKIVKKHKENLGLRKHILSQGEAFDNYDALIILEDDIIVSPAFYKYAQQTIAKYYDNEDIAGISLYSFPLNPYTYLPFEPYKDENDVYFMNTAQSWGQIWLKEQWQDFYRWYLNNTDFTYSDEIPKALFSWKKSWLKYHTRYCIEKNKFFVYPYFSFSSNCGDAGTHTEKNSNLFQTVMQTKLNGNLILPTNPSLAIRYDAFFQNKDICHSLGLSEEECEIDLYGYKTNNKSYSKRYLLSLSAKPYKIVKSYGLTYHPIESNIFKSYRGKDIFLYDTQNKQEIGNINNRNFVIYIFRIISILRVIKLYRISNIFLDLKRRFLK